MRRISIVGVSASGKSTLAARLSPMISAPSIELDALFWKAGWQKSEPEELRSKTYPLLSQERWIVDGNYGQVREEIWRRADTIIWVHIPFLQNLWSVIRRTGIRVFTRQKLWAENRESLRTLFSKESIVLWVWNTHQAYEERYRNAFRQMSLLPDSPRIITLRGRDQARIFLESVKRHPQNAVVEKVMVYPIRFQKSDDPEILVYRNAKTGFVEVMSETRIADESTCQIARREFKLEGWTLLPSHPQRFATASQIVKVDLPPEELAVAEGSGRTMSALRAIGAKPRLRPEFQLHHAYWANIRGAPERLFLKTTLECDSHGKDLTLFWIGLAKAEKTMNKTAKAFLPELREALQAYRNPNLQETTALKAAAVVDETVEHRSEDSAELAKTAQSALKPLGRDPAPPEAGL